MQCVLNIDEHQETDNVMDYVSFFLTSIFQASELWHWKIDDNLEERYLDLKHQELLLVSESIKSKRALKQS